MLLNRTKGVFQLTMLGQCVLVTVGFWVWLLCFIPWIQFPGGIFGRYLIYNEFLVLGLLVGGSHTRLNSGFPGPSFELASEIALRQTATALFYLLVYLAALRDQAISTLFFLSFIPVLYILLLATVRCLPEPLAHRLFVGTQSERILLVGKVDKIRRARPWWLAKERLGFHAVGALSDDSTEKEIESVPVLGRPEDSESIVKEHAITQVLVVEIPSNQELLREISSVCERRGIRLLLINHLDSVLGRPIALSEDQGLCVISLRDEPLENPFNRTMKRVLDVVVSLPMVSFLLPILIGIVWFFQRLQSPGPLYYLQERPGLRNRPFHIYKFRTMHVTNPDMNRLPTADDPRLYPAGRWFRKLSVDEFPQFWNVLRGEMSVVGPRPHLMSHNALFRRLYRKAYIRAFIKPGITGLSQVRGLRGNLGSSSDVARRVETDIYYLEHWSLGLDCWLILRTALQVVFPPRTAV